MAVPHFAQRCFDIKSAVSAPSSSERAAKDSTGVKFKDIIEEVFSQSNRTDSQKVIDSHSSLWKQMSSGSQGFSGKKTVNARTMFNLHFEENDSDDIMALVEDIEPVKTKAKVSEEVLNNLFVFE